MLKVLMKSIREYKNSSIMTSVYVALEVIVECIIPFLTAMLVNKIEKGANVGTVAKYGVLLFAMALVSLSMGVLSGINCAKASCGFAKNLRHDLFYKVQTFSFENIDKFSSSSLVTRLTTDVTNVQMAYMMIIRTAIRCPLMLVFAFIMSIRLGGKLSLIFAGIIPVLAIALFSIIFKVRELFRRVFKKYDRLNESVQENIRGMRVVKTFVREDFEKKKFSRASDDVCHDFTVAEKILALNNPIMQLCIYTSMMLISFLVSKLVITTNGVAAEIGTLSGMITYSMQILMSMMMVSMIFVMVTMSIESGNRIAEVLKEVPALCNPEKPVFEITDGSIVFDNVSFKYSKSSDNFALEGININIKSGSTVGIIGGTGSSKTTLVNLISRLYDVTEGSVIVGGRDVREYDIETLRNEVSVVLQKNVLFSGTIAENLRWGDINATDEELIRICKLAQADSFIEEIPEKYNAIVEQGGANFSGGQKQRLCIARALLKKPKILILDDSTSAVDTKTDALIRHAFKTEIPNTTKIIIAQRISSIMDSDMIIVMDNGKISAVGNHNELMKTSDIYREVYTSQTKAGDENE